MTCEHMLDSPWGPPGAWPKSVDRAQRTCGRSWWRAHPAEPADPLLPTTKLRDPGSPLGAPCIKAVIIDWISQFEKKQTHKPFSAFHQTFFCWCWQKGEQAGYEYTYPLLNLSVAMQTLILAHWHTEQTCSCLQPCWVDSLCHQSVLSAHHLVIFLFCWQICPIEIIDGKCQGFVSSDASSSCDVFKFMIMDFWFIACCLMHMARRCALMALGYQPLRAHRYWNSGVSAFLLVGLHVLKY